MLPVHSKHFQIVMFVLNCPFKARQFDVRSVANRVTDNGLRAGDVALCCPEASGRQGYGACTLLVAGFLFKDDWVNIEIRFIV
jgi:hypothetical protein